LFYLKVESSTGITAAKRACTLQHTRPKGIYNSFPANHPDQPLSSRVSQGSTDSGAGNDGGGAGATLFIKAGLL
jgi:hypothetical protein